MTLPRAKWYAMARIVGILLAAGAGLRASAATSCLRRCRRRRLAGTPSASPLGVAAAASPDRSAAAIRSPSSARATRNSRRSCSAAGLRVVPCINADDGMGASLACGVAAAGDADGWVIALADMPWIAPATIRAIGGGGRVRRRYRRAVVSRRARPSGRLLAAAIATRSRR